MSCTPAGCQVATLPGSALLGGIGYRWCRPAACCGLNHWLIAGNPPGSVRISTFDVMGWEPGPMNMLHRLAIFIA